MKHPKKQNNQPPAEKSVQIRQTSFYSGKLPPPEMMAQYNHIDPTFADRILSMSEAEQIHVHKVEKTKLKTGIIMASIGMFCGVVALSVLCFLLFYSVKKENTTVAVAITTMLASVVAIFVLQKHIREKNPK